MKLSFDETRKEWLLEQVDWSFHNELISAGWQYGVNNKWEQIYVTGKLELACANGNAVENGRVIRKEFT